LKLEAFLRWREHPRSCPCSPASKQVTHHLPITAARSAWHPLPIQTNQNQKSIMTNQSSIIKHQKSPITLQSSIINHQSSPITHQSSIITNQSSQITNHSSQIKKGG
jgi:hypothetical protein